MTYILLLPVDSESIAVGFNSSYNTLEEAITAANNTPGAQIEHPIMGGTEIVFRIPPATTT
jgi:hypothetical protein